jgi:uncharacterized protein (DUF58 family)
LNTNPAVTVDPLKKTTTQAAGVLLNNFGLIGVALLLILAAWAGQTIIVVILGLSLSAAGLARLWSHFSLRGVYVERHLTEQRVFPGESVELKLRVVNRKPLPLPWLEISDQVPAGFAEGLAPGYKPGFDSISRSTSIMWYSAISWKYQLLCKKRGYYTLGPLTVSSGDIFGFYPRTAVEPISDHLIVYPRIYTLPPFSIPSLYPMGEVRSDKRIFEDPSRTIGVRDYSPGDSLRRIHWKTSARHQMLQVKVFEPTTTLKVAVFLAIDSFQHTGLWNFEEMENGISTVASLANYLVGKNSQVGFWSNSQMADSGQPAYIPSGSGVGQLVQILEALAKVVPAYNNTFSDFFQAVRKNLPMGTTLLFVFSQIPEKLHEILTDLRESGYKVLVFQVGAVTAQEAIPDITWFQSRQPGEIIEVSAMDQ